MWLMSKCVFWKVGFRTQIGYLSNPHKIYDSRECHLQPAGFQEDAVSAINFNNARSEQVLQMTMVLLTFAETKVGRAAG